MHEVIKFRCDIPASEKTHGKPLVCGYTHFTWQDRYQVWVQDKESGRVTERVSIETEDLAKRYFQQTIKVLGGSVEDITQISA